MSDPKKIEDFFDVLGYGLEPYQRKYLHAIQNYRRGRAVQQRRISIVDRIPKAGNFETFLAKLFGKKKTILEVHPKDDWLHVTVSFWRGKYYVIAQEVVEKTSEGVVGLQFDVYLDDELARSPYMEHREHRIAWLQALNEFSNEKMKDE